MRVVTFRRAAILPALFAANMMGCSAPVYETGAPPPSLMSESPPDSVQLGVRGGGMLTLAHPRIQADTIWGYDTTGQHTGVPVKDVEWGLARSKRDNDPRKFVVGAIVVTFVLEAWFLYALAQSFAHGN